MMLLDTMMWIDLAQNTTVWATSATAGLADSATWSEAGQGLFSQIHFDWSTLAQFDTDVFAGFRASMNNFVKSGQVWALIIGFVFGYLIRGMTTYN
jgi:hypothetical protein